MFGYEPEYIDCGDARIACYDIGRGHPLILLHGNGEDSSYWNAQISEFTRFMRVIAVDSRGHGASDSGTKGLSFELMAQDLKHILDVKDIKKAFFLGFSDGGNLAIKFALQWPDMVEKLVLNGANVEMFFGVKPHVQLTTFAGEHDMIKDRQTREMAAHIPHCRVEVFRDGDHFVAAKQPSRFNRTVMEFILGR